MDATSHATSADARIATASRRSGFVRAGWPRPGSRDAAFNPSGGKAHSSSSSQSSKPQPGREGGRARPSISARWAQIRTTPWCESARRWWCQRGTSSDPRWPWKCGGRHEATSSGSKRSGSCMNIPATKAMMPQMPIVPPRSLKSALREGAAEDDKGTSESDDAALAGSSSEHLEGFGHHLGHAGHARFGHGAQADANPTVERDEVDVPSGTEVHHLARAVVLQPRKEAVVRWIEWNAMSVARRHKGCTAAGQQLGQHLEPLAPRRPVLGPDGRRWPRFAVRAVDLTTFRARSRRRLRRRA